MTFDAAEWSKKMDRKIKRAKLREPGPDQYVDECHWSKTGWAIWNKDGSCTCQPAKAPTRQ